MEQYDADYLEDHIRGLIYGNAIGDAIGLLTEFMVKEEAMKYYGNKKQLEFEHKVPDMHRQRFVSGDWTDDTDQMILIMMSIIDKCGKVSAYDFGSKLKNWAQKGFSELGDLGGMGIGSTTSHVLRHQLYDTDPHAAAQSIWEESGCSVAPNGALMRTSVLGAFQFNSLLKVKENTLEICKVTHFDPRCQASTVAMTTAIALMLQRFPDVIKKDGSFDVTAIVKNAYDSSKLLLAKKAHRKELKRYMHKKKLSSLKLCEYKNIGYTYKCLGAGFWALKQDNFRDALQEIVMEAGDADTNGAVAGALLGCKLGAKNLPEVWMNSLIYKEWLDVKIDRFLPLIIPSYVRKFEDGYVPVILSKKIE